ncbi:hypothetical protein Hanom_Chr16g01476991 [Helianthus anomalus]
MLNHQIFKGNNHNQQQSLPYTRSECLNALEFGGRRSKSVSCTSSPSICGGHMFIGNNNSQIFKGNNHNQQKILPYGCRVVGMPT